MHTKLKLAAMRKHLVVIILLLVVSTITSCFKGDGKLSGNAYYKYNNYVGNKPDAGTKITIFSKDDTTQKPIKLVCDVSGNFTVDKIKEGNYVVVAVSNSTNEETSDFLYENYHIISEYPFLFVNAKKSIFFERYLEYQKLKSTYDIWLISNAYEKQIDSLKYKASMNVAKGCSRSQVLSDEINIAKAQRDFQLEKLNKFSKLALLKKQLNTISDSILNVHDPKSPFINHVLFPEYKFKDGILIGKIRAASLKIENNKTSNIVFDFGITNF